MLADGSAAYAQGRGDGARGAGGAQGYDGQLTTAREDYAEGYNSNLTRADTDYDDADNAVSPRVAEGVSTMPLHDVLFYTVAFYLLPPLPHS